jgi:hypothetical protein
MNIVFPRLRGAVGAVAVGKRMSRARRRASARATSARAPAAVPHCLYQGVGADGQPRTVIVEIAEVRCVAGEIGGRR